MKNTIGIGLVYQETDQYRPIIELIEVVIMQVPDHYTPIMETLKILEMKYAGTQIEII